MFCETVSSVKGELQQLLLRKTRLRMGGSKNLNVLFEFVQDKAFSSMFRSFHLKKLLALMLAYIL